MAPVPRSQRRASSDLHGARSACERGRPAWPHPVVGVRVGRLLSGEQALLDRKTLVLNAGEERSVKETRTVRRFTPWLLVLSAGVLLGAALPAQANREYRHGSWVYNRSVMVRGYRDRPELAGIREALMRHRFGDIRRIRIHSIDREGNWAVAHIAPVGASADIIQVLLHRSRGTWRVDTYGSSLAGAGRRYHVPHRLWERWGL